MSEAQRTRLAYGLAALFALLCVAINPVGYVGGGADDEQYLAAARCWVAHGAPCLPTSHWWTRWPAFAPSAAGIAAFGDHRWSIAVGPLLFWAAALALLGVVAGRWFGRMAGALAIALLAATPAFTALALTPNTDIPELAFMLAALAAATLADERQSKAWALLGGLAAGLALQARDTSVLFLGASALAWLLLARDRRRLLLWAIPGLLLAAGSEIAAYALATGQPLLRYTLALHHTQILSKALPPGFDTSQSPILNPHYIAAWSREAGLHVWWPIDPWLNLLAAPRILSLLWLAMIAALAMRDRLSRAARWRAGRLALLVAIWALALVYGLGVDPKSRMFLPAAAALAAIASALIVAGWRAGLRLVAGALALFHLGYGLITLARLPSPRADERHAAAWLRAHPGDVEADLGARSYLTFVPGADRLPPLGSGKRHVLMLAGDGCEALVAPDATGARKGRVVASSGRPGEGQLCLLERFSSAR